MDVGGIDWGGDGAVVRRGTTSGEGWIDDEISGMENDGKWMTLIGENSWNDCEAWLVTFDPSELLIL